LGATGRRVIISFTHDKNNQNVADFLKECQNMKSLFYVFCEILKDDELAFMSVLRQDTDRVVSSQPHPRGQYPLATPIHTIHTTTPTSTIMRSCHYFMCDTTILTFTKFFNVLSHFFNISCYFFTKQKIHIFLLC